MMSPDRSEHSSHEAPPCVAVSVNFDTEPSPDPHGGVGALHGMGRRIPGGALSWPVALRIVVCVCDWRSLEVRQPPRILLSLPALHNFLPWPRELSEIVQQAHQPESCGRRTGWQTVGCIESHCTG